MQTRWLHYTAYTLLWLGGLNWGLVGLFNYNLVNALLGGYPALEKWVYVLVGLSAVFTLTMHKSYCKICGEMKSSKSQEK